MATEILELVGQHVRAARAARHWTIRELAERSGVSVRFLVQLEAGRGNISVKRLADLARAFKIPTAELLSDDYPDAPRVVAPARRRSASSSRGGCASASSSSIVKSRRRRTCRWPSSSLCTERTITAGW